MNTITQAQREAMSQGSANSVALKTLGLRGRGEVFILDSKCIRLITRASRFLRKDAESFMEVLEAANAHTGRTLSGHVLIERAPVCSKARSWLEERGVRVETPN